MTESPTQTRPARRVDMAIGFALMGILFGALLIALLLANAGLIEPRVSHTEQLAITRITLPRPGLILVEVVNAGSAPATIAQVQVDGAFWEFAVEPGGELPRRARATLSIPYPWVQGETHRITVITSTGATFVGDLAPSKG